MYCSFGSQEVSKSCWKVDDRRPVNLYLLTGFIHTGKASTAVLIHLYRFCGYQRCSPARFGRAVAVIISSKQMSSSDVTNPSVVSLTFLGAGVPRPRGIHLIGKSREENIADFCTYTVYAYVGDNRDRHQVV